MQLIARDAVMVLMVSLLAGCSPGEIDEKDFPRHGASAMCQKERECTRGAWLNAYYGQADCQETWARELEELVDFQDDRDCDYSKKAAGSAVEDVRSMDCEEFWEDVVTDPEFSVINDIWDDCGGGPVTSFPYSGTTR